MSKPLRIGIAGLGTVGGGTLKILQQQSGMLAERAGRPITVAGVCAKNKRKDRGMDTSKLKWFDRPADMANDPDIDVIVETIGGAEGVARELVTAALKNGKSVVTANKALIAHHGVELAKLAEEHGAVLAFEAAVAGGIPIIKGLRDGLAANNFSRITGILNGTCNYILTTMWNEKRGFGDVLKEAQAKGYAEADPSFDIDGVDTAHKLAILASLAYGTAPAIDKVSVEGIRRVTLHDMQFADELGYAIKLLGVAAKTDRGIELRVHPCLVKKQSQLATVPGADNAVLVEGDAVGRVLLEGQGAGEGPTASSVIADLVDIARGANYKPFTLPAASLAKTPKFADMSKFRSEYYLRLGVKDKPGVLAAITDILKQEGISVHSAKQPPADPGEAVQLVFTTHETSESSMQKAIAAIKALGSVVEDPYMIRIEPMERARPSATLAREAAAVRVK